MNKKSNSCHKYFWKAIPDYVLSNYLLVEHHVHYIPPAVPLDYFFFLFLFGLICSQFTAILLIDAIIQNWGRRAGNYQFVPVGKWGAQTGGQ